MLLSKQAQMIILFSKVKTKVGSAARKSITSGERYMYITYQSQG